MVLYYIDLCKNEKLYNRMIVTTLQLFWFEKHWEEFIILYCKWFCTFSFYAGFFFFAREGWPGDGIQVEVWAIVRNIQTAQGPAHTTSQCVSEASCRWVLNINFKNSLNEEVFTLLPVSSKYVTVAKLHFQNVKIYTWRGIFFYIQIFFK